MLAGTGIASRGLGDEVELLELINDLGKRILLDSLIDGPAFEGHEGILVVKSSPNREYC